MRLIDADLFIKEQIALYCEKCERRMGMKNGKKKFVYKIGDAPCRACEVMDMIDDVENAPTVEPTFKPIAEVKFDKEQLQEIVDNAKAEVLASVERPQGEWIVICYDPYDKENRELMCSQCGCTYWKWHYYPNFCDNCGAKMKGGAEE